MTSALIKYHIERHPTEAASILDNATAGQQLEFLSSLEPDLRASILPHLLPASTATYLSSTDPADAAETLIRLRASAIAMLLQSAPYTARMNILSLMPEEKRETVRHQIRYPRDSAGAILMTSVPACRDSSNVRQAKRIVRRLAASQSPLLVVLDGEMRPRGSLEFSQLLKLREREVVASHLRPFPHKFRVRTEMSVVANHPSWETEDFLPAVEHDDQFVGLISKARLFNLLAGQRAKSSNTDELTTTLLALAELFWKPAAEFFANALSQSRGDGR